MVLTRLDPTPQEFTAATGWELKPEGACRGEVCVPLPPGVVGTGVVDVVAVADRLGTPIAHDERHGLWALGGPSGGRGLDRARIPELVLDDFGGKAFDVATLRGRKVLLVAWASW